MKFTNYYKIRDKIKTGDVYFTASRSLVGGIIRSVSRSKLSHCGVFKVSEGRVTMLEAQVGSKIQEVYASHALKDKDIIFLDTSYYRNKYGITDNMIKDFFERMEGQEYDTIGMLFSLWFKIPNNKMFCSEMVAKALHIEMPHLKRGITPADLYTALYLMR